MFYLVPKVKSNSDLEYCCFLADGLVSMKDSIFIGNTPHGPKDTLYQIGSVQQFIATFYVPAIHAITEDKGYSNLPCIGEENYTKFTTAVYEALRDWNEPILVYSTSDSIEQAIQRISESDYVNAEKFRADYKNLRMEKAV